MNIAANICTRCIGAFGGTLGCCFLINAPRSTALPSSLIAVLGYALYATMEAMGFGILSAYFFSTVVVTIICEVCARRMYMPATIFLLSALIPLVPGYNFYCARLALVENNASLAAAETLKSLQTVAAIAVGAAVTSVIFRTISRRHTLKQCCCKE